MTDRVAHPDKPVVAVLGGRGMLGTDLVAACAAGGFDVRSYDLPEFDVTDAEHLRGVVEASDAILNCAAYTDVDGAETHTTLAQRVNAEAVGRLGELAARYGRWVLHFSTDFVFDGTLDRPYAETDAPNPINEYGRSKLAGEERLAQSGCAHCLVRLEWTYGLHGNSFVTKTIERAVTERRLAVVEDQIGSPTPTTLVAEVTCKLLGQRTEGMFHLASAGYVSRFGMTQFVFERLGLDAEVTPCCSSDYLTPATRPLNSRFDCRKIEALLKAPLEPWQKGLECFLRQL
ncbi:MAG: dTDP-4-dehydrorhamnose reductase [Sedimentisphaerales bacterium]|nr:dTDP-4-dehydrorhamnose reductase [Sedimentisphaerales bacterium]NLT75031.1 dTDP-4-dehydrorhamnose reductase [Planctomycetota bacterium]